MLCLLMACSNAPTRMLSPRETPMTLSGRAVYQEDGGLRFGYPGVSVHMLISGGTLSLEAASSSGQNHLLVAVEGETPFTLTPGTQPARYTLTTGTQPRWVRITHLSETWHGLVTLHSFQLQGGRFLQPPPAPTRKLLVIGDSVTCGEAVHRTADCQKDTRWWRPDQSWGMLLGEALEAEVHLVCYGGRGLIRSWNGNTAELQAPDFVDLAIAVERGPTWDHREYQPDVILVSLGTNDFSLGIGPLPEREAFVDAYVDFVKHLLEVYPQAQLVLTEGAIVNDEADPSRPQKTRLRDYIAATVAAVNSARVTQLPSRHYPGDSCDAHPTGAQHRQMAEDFLAPVKNIGWP